MAELQGVIDAIHAGSFTPDCQQSDFFKRPATGAQTPEDPCLHGEHSHLVGVSAGDVQNDMSELHECAGGEIGPPGLPHAESLQGNQAEVDQDGTEKADQTLSDSSSDSSVGSSSSDSEAVEPTSRVKRFPCEDPRRTGVVLSTASPPWSIGLMEILTMA